MKGLSGKTAVVTGGSSGIGQAIAIRLGHEGANVAINYVGRAGGRGHQGRLERGADRCMSEVESSGGRALLVEADVSDEQAVEGMFKTVAGELGPIDLLVNN